MRKLYILVLFFSILSANAQPLGFRMDFVEQEDRAAGCVPPSSFMFMELNNVKALIHTAGNLWQITGQNFCHYEVPKGSGIMALFSSALWLGGVDVNGQLKLAALRYREGQDYWTGPLMTDGTAEISPDICAKYDRHFKVTKDEVRLFNEWFIAGLNDQANGTTTQAENFPNYKIPKSILEWPAHGDPTLNQDYYLAPFYDRNLDGHYDPVNDGDYPWYDLNKEVDCRNDRQVTLFGDETIWWVMNDKGNIHTESGGDPIGMEIKCQAFAFATSNEINDMTFYNYELNNRSTQTLYNTYFGVMVDVALGGPLDDYVGCDVERGLGYAYNGDAFDESAMGFPGYGANPPAIGVDFFEGPYQDDDGVDNPLTTNISEALTSNGIPYSGLGIGYGDGIIDNERLGMRRFIYYNNLGGGGNVSQTDPTTAQHYYAFLSGYWKDGTRFAYGGTGHPADPGSNPLVAADFMFPGDTDPFGWGTGGVPQPTWTEETAGNPPYDRRFAQASGPFTLKPGAVNNITFGVVFARSYSGDPFESVILLQKADDKAQALFDNCFEVLEGPHAPELSIQELENEIIISIYNISASNNATEEYEEIDPEIVNVDGIPNFDNKYKFQGYQVYQVRDKNISASELYDITKARLVFQTDIEDGITKMINYEYDNLIGADVPIVKVNGENKGIRHSFSVKEDLFATGLSRKLVNFKKYYFIAISYSSNYYKPYVYNNPLFIDGQKLPYLQSRKGAIGNIKIYEAIPHKPSFENGGTIQNVPFGYEIPLTKLDGWGNGGRWTDLDENSENIILENNFIQTPTYKSNASPVEVKVIDPINLPEAEFQLLFVPDAENSLKAPTWKLINLTTLDTVYSAKNITALNEQLIPEWGISVTIKQVYYETFGLTPDNFKTEPIGAKMIFSDSSKIWLSGIQDNDAFYPTNWIRSGTYVPEAIACTTPSYTNPCYYGDYVSEDPDQKYEKLLDGIVAPFRLVGRNYLGMPIGAPNATFTNNNYSSTYFNPKNSQDKSSFSKLHGIDIVITHDKSKWTRCPVIENNFNSSQTLGGASIMELRESNSVDIDGNAEAGKGMGWFPGYAINVETGERLNMAFAENSWLGGDNGKDMIWNPSHRIIDNVGLPLMGGGHFVYVFGNSNSASGMPAYDNGSWMYDKLKLKTTATHREVWDNCMWVFAPLLIENHDYLESDVRIQLRVSHPYQKRIYTGINNGNPAYVFTTNGIASQINRTDIIQSELDLIKVVPNPYYAYSEYETSIIDNRVKITNLPQQCTITIFNITGQLVRQYQKDNPLTYLDWDLKNHKGIPISSGMYIIHIDIPGVGEKVLKWYGAMRTIDLQDF